MIKKTRRSDRLHKRVIPLDANKRKTGSRVMRYRGMPANTRAKRDTDRRATKRSSRAEGSAVREKNPKILKERMTPQKILYFDPSEREYQ